MPYIVNDERGLLDRGLPVETAGQLNYVLTRTVWRFLKRKGQPRYQDFNDAIGALEGAKLELYRRMVAPYEDLKIEENGDVYE